MISPWKAFLGEAVLMFALGTACTFIAGIWINDKSLQLSSGEAMRIAMRVGALVASPVLGVIGSLLFWRMKPLLWAVGVGAGLLSGHLGIVIFAILATILVYWAANQLRMLFGFYRPEKSTDSEE